MKRHPKFYSPCTPQEDCLGEEMQPYGRMLALRILAGSGPRVIRQIHETEAESLAEVFEEKRCPDPKDIPRKAITYLKRLEKREQIAGQPLLRNLDLLSRAVPLSATDRELICLHIVGRCFQPLYKLLDAYGDLSDFGLWRLLAIALKRDPHSIRQCLGMRGILRSCGLLMLQSHSDSFWIKLSMLEKLRNALLSAHESLDAILSVFVANSPSAVYELDEFESFTETMQILASYLRKACQESIKGCNILLYGPSGVGKTEAVRTIAGLLNYKLYEIEVENEDGDPMTGEQRMQNYRFVQALLAAKRDALILFDEVEDAFPIEKQFVPFFTDEPGSGQNKAWTNQILEENQTPAFWLANRARQIDPAFLRRFDFVLEMKTLPRSTRRRRLLKCLDGIKVSEKWIERIVRIPDLTHADLARARKVLTLVESNGSNLELQMELAFKGHLSIRTKRKVELSYPKPKVFHQDILNTDMDIAQLGDCLGGNSRARVCLYGPPGTGKTLFAYHLAETLDKPILVKRASDILSMWVGGTEQNLAGMFKEASDEESILLLDEADSFLQDRKGAHHRWEITEVNELLTQMECYPGIFICATNFMDSLDKAVLRRFPIKIRFDYLRRDQSEKCFVRTLADGGCSIEGEVPEHVRMTLATMNNLTPGDFAALVERWRILSIVPTPELLLSALEEESRLKPESRKSQIGFVTSHPSF